MVNAANEQLEWLEPDGHGGFASGTVAGLRTRRYHALLLAATRAPAGRVVLVNGVQAWLEAGPDRSQRQALTAQRYAPDVIAPAGAAEVCGFSTQPWPTWRLRLDDGRIVVAECLVVKGLALTLLRWRLAQPAAPAVPCWLRVRPLLSGRDYHALHHENPAFDFHAEIANGAVRWRPYASLPAIVARSNGRYLDEPDWYRNFCYVRERERGLDCIEDLATPGLFEFDLARGPALLVLAAGDALDEAWAGLQHGATASATADFQTGFLALAERERARRASYASTLERAADAYLVPRGAGLSMLAGFPWFTDWGRDTFIAMRGLLLATGRRGEAEAILLGWSGFVSEGMLPNRFPDDGGAPEYNSVDASLWFIVAVHDYLAGGPVQAGVRDRLTGAVNAILEGYAGGTRYGIGADTDGLLHAGAPGMQLTWMDAKVGDWVVTPRAGKPVEVQALWINALRIGTAWDPRWAALADQAHAAFARRFIAPDGGLHDVVDVGGVAGACDASVRPNQIFAVGGLPFALLEGPAARAVLERVRADLLTPMGLRTLAPGSPGYAGRYRGTPLQRDAAYHQGTVWPWLMGAYVQAWLRVHGNGVLQREEARARFMQPLVQALGVAGLDHLSEVADGDAPHYCGGAPFQAWSLGELLRIRQMLAEEAPASDRVVVPR